MIGLLLFVNETLTGTSFMCRAQTQIKGAVIVELPANKGKRSKGVFSCTHRGPIIKRGGGDGEKG